MVDEETKADIRNRIQEAKADNAPMDAMAFALHYQAQDEHKELMEFICREARKSGTLIKGCSETV